MDLNQAPLHRGGSADRGSSADPVALPISGLSGIQVGRIAAPLREQVLDGLRNAILDFTLKPGQRLVERELIEQIGVSRTTVREVLRELTAEGLAVMIPQKGVVVYAPSAQEGADLYAVRASLEGLAVERFIARASAGQLAALRAGLANIEEIFAEGGDVQAMLRAKDLFYERLMAGAASPTIEQILRGVRARVRLLRATSLAQPGRPTEVISEVRTLTEAIATRDVRRATKVCVAHLDHGATTGLRALATGFDAAGGRP